jgi:cysteine synthase A
MKYGVLYSPEEAEGTRRRHQSDSVVEGVGLTRVTANFNEAIPFIDEVFKCVPRSTVRIDSFCNRVTDAEAVAMSRHLVLNDGLFLGSSSAVNLVAAVRMARKLGKRRARIVTILCDSGSRHYSRFWNDAALSERGIPISADISSIVGT